MISDKLTNPTVKAAVDALQSGNRTEWAALIEADAQLFADGTPRSLHAFNEEAVGHERFTSIDRVDNHGLNVVGHFHSDQWGDFRTYFKFQLSPSGRIKRLDEQAGRGVGRRSARTA